MGILLDIGFVIIILLCVVFGYKKCSASLWMHTKNLKKAKAPTETIF